MATFPLDEKTIFTLGQEMSAGLKANPDIYPSPPVDTILLDEKLASFVTARDTVVAAQSATERAITAKQSVLQDLADNIKLNLRYAEMTVDFDDGKLKAIGWGGRRERTPLAPPGRVQNLTGAREAEGRVNLQWEKPVVGGKVAAYQIMCRNRATGGDWNIEGMSISASITLTEQPQGKEIEYGVMAMNKAGEGPISNTVVVVL